MFVYGGDRMQNIGNTNNIGILQNRLDNLRAKGMVVDIVERVNKYRKQVDLNTLETCSIRNRSHNLIMELSYNGQTIIVEGNDINLIGNKAIREASLRWKTLVGE